MKPDQRAVEALARMALLEDAPWGDLTSEAFLPSGLQVSAQLVAREEGTFCGEDVFSSAMSLAGTVTVRFLRHDRSEDTRLNSSHDVISRMPSSA